MDRRIPPALWGALCALGIITLLQILPALARPSFASVGTVAVNIAIIFGLYHGHRWAFVVALVTAGGGTVLVLFHDLAFGVIVFLGNAMVIAPLVLARRYFFVPQTA